MSLSDEVGVNTSRPMETWAVVPGEPAEVRRRIGSTVLRYDTADPLVITFELAGDGDPDKPQPEWYIDRQFLEQGCREPVGEAFGVQVAPDALWPGWMRITYLPLGLPASRPPEAVATEFSTIFLPRQAVVAAGRRSEEILPMPYESRACELAAEQLLQQIAPPPQTA